MIAICHTWQDAARCATVDCKNLPEHGTPLPAFDLFDEYQTGSVPLNEYLQDLAAFAGCSKEDALRLHNGILVGEFAGMLDLVHELRSNRIRTGCLSNTNKPHWEVLTSPELYPAIDALDMKMASHLVGINKPAPKIYHLFCVQFGLLPERIAFFDDNMENVVAAAACGWHARHINPSLDTPTQLRTHLTELGVI